MVASEQADAQKCNPVCLPPPEEEPEEETPPPPPPSSPPPSILVINVDWGSGDPRTRAPLVEGDLSRYVDYLRGRFSEWFAKSAPSGFRTWRVTAGGSYEIPPPSIPVDPTRCTPVPEGEAFRSITDSPEARAREHGLNPTAYSVVVVGWSRPYCEVPGITQNRHIGITSPKQALHEFGHYMGLRADAHALSAGMQPGRRFP